MTTWLRRLRGAIGMAAVWGIAGFLLGGLMELADPDGQYADIWPMVVALPCTLGGLLFSLVLGVAGRGRRFEDLSLPKFTAWGAASGLLLGLLPMVISRLAEPRAFSLTNLLVLGVTTTMCAGLAAATLLVARRAEAGSGGEAASVGDGARRSLPAADAMTRPAATVPADRIHVE